MRPFLLLEKAMDHDERYPSFLVSNTGERFEVGEKMTHHQLILNKIDFFANKVMGPEGEKEIEDIVSRTDGDIDERAFQLSQFAYKIQDLAVDKGWIIVRCWDSGHGTYWAITIKRLARPTIRLIENFVDFVLGINREWGQMDADISVIGPNGGNVSMTLDQISAGYLQNHV